MKKINTLRQTLLQSGLNIQPEDLIARVVKGELQHHYRHPDDITPARNHKLLLKYDAELLIMDYAGAPEAVLHIVALWQSEHQPGHAANTITVKADILDNNSVDLLITIADLTDTYNPVIEQDGTRIFNCPPEHLNRQAYP